MAEVIKNTLTKILVSFFIFLMITVWIFSGWPQIWNKLSLPPEFQEVWQPQIAVAAPETENLHADGAGAGNGWTDVTQANLATNDNDTTKAYSTAKNAAHLYATIANTSTCTGTVNSVTAKTYAYSGATGQTQAIGMCINCSVDDVFDGQEQPSTNPASYSYHDYIRTEKPAGGAWTCADVDNMQVIVDPDKGGAPTGDWRVTELWITVDYTPVTVSISLNRNTQAFGFVPLDTTVNNSADPIVITVDVGPATLRVKTTKFTDATYTWELGTSNGDYQVRWRFSKDGSSWTIFEAADPTDYLFEENVPESETRDLHLELLTPTATYSWIQYSATVTITAY